MTYCPPAPPIRLERAPCRVCGAITEVDAETRCQPTSDETGEVYCGTDFDGDGYARAPTAESLQALDAWIDVHQGCDREQECIAKSDGELTSEVES